VPWIDPSSWVFCGGWKIGRRNLTTRQKFQGQELSHGYGTTDNRKNLNLSYLCNCRGFTSHLSTRIMRGV